MTVATTIAQMLVRVTGIFQIVMGLLFWSGHALGMIGIHMLSGMLLVLGLWTLALLAGVSRAKPGLAALGAVWGFVVVALGMMQGQLLVGSTHWVIQVLHLAVGIAAMAMAERLADGVKKGRAGVDQSQ